MDFSNTFKQGTRGFVKRGGRGKKMVAVAKEEEEVKTVAVAQHLKDLNEDMENLNLIKGTVKD